MPKFINSDNKEFTAAVKSIAAELKRANELKALELRLLATTAKPFHTRDKLLVEDISRGEF